MLVLAVTIIYTGFNFTDLISPNPFSTDSTDPLEFIGIAYTGYSLYDNT
jgi:hypothetical protein